MYCGFDEAADIVASHGNFISFLPTDQALDFLQNTMVVVAPLIGRAMKFNKRGKKKMTVKELLYTIPNNCDTCWKERVLWPLYLCC